MTTRIAVLTISDSAASGGRVDRSGDAIVSWAGRHNLSVHARDTVADQSLEIVTRLLAWADRDEVALVITTGGTGIGPRDVTPGATRAVIDREVAGIAESIRVSGRQQTARAALTGGVVGIRGRTLIVNLPGSIAAVEDALGVLAPLVDHVVALLRGETEH